MNKRILDEIDLKLATAAAVARALDYIHKKTVELHNENKELINKLKELKKDEK